MIKRRNSIDGQFAPHTIEMIKSPAWSVLSLSARRVLDRIEIEHADHGGNDNGRLPVTYDDFERYASQADRRCSAFTAMSEYLSGLAPELARGLAA